MRPQTKQRLDELEKREKRYKILAFAGGLAALLLFSSIFALYNQPGEHLRDVDATVVHSAVGANEFGQRFHILKARLANGKTTSVQTHVKSPLQPGRKITLELRQNFYGSRYYTLKP